MFIKESVVLAIGPAERIVGDLEVVILSKDDASLFCVKPSVRVLVWRTNPWRCAINRWRFSFRLSGVSGRTDKPISFAATSNRSS